MLSEGSVLPVIEHSCRFGFHIHQNGLLVRFSEPVDRVAAEQTASHFIQCWNYRYGEAYGSPEFSTTHAGIRGHDVLMIRSAHVLADEHTVFLEIPDLQPVSQLHVRMHVEKQSQQQQTTAIAFSNPVDENPGHDLFVTVNALDQPYQDFPGWQHEEKTVRCSSAAC